MADPQPELRAVFCEALDRQDPQEQGAYLDRACQGRPELRARVEALLQAHAEASSFLQEASGSLPASIDYPLGEAAGTIIGPYKLVEQIGEGGFGVVFLAEQQQPVRRRVALKILKPGMDTRQVVARFEAERQALALMDHPNIARVFDGGATASSRPYFVMELVKGTPITTYCDERQLTPRQRLELFVAVCQALQHAHQKGIIHRDIKPSNVLVAPYDGKPVVKVIDFGVAKATGPQLTERTLVTGFGAVVGTLQYMSPEQAELNNQDIDTRSDVYSLGVLLYELLTGTTPLPAARLKQTPLPELLRLIREEEPPRPSTRLSSSDTLPAIATARQSAPAKLRRLVRGELDWIVMKALEKDRNRRYETASAFAGDVERYLRDEPVLAGPPSVGYRLRKFLRRNKGPVLATTLLFMALLGGVIGTTSGMIWALTAESATSQALAGVVSERDAKEKARALAAAKAKEAEEAAKAEREAKNQALNAAEEARLAKGEAETAAAKEKSAREAAQKSLEQADKASRILASIFCNLDPNRDENQGIPLRAQLGEQLAKAAELLEGEAVGDAERVARLQVLLGQTMTSLGYGEQAIPLLTKARPTFDKLPDADPLEKFAIMYYLATAYELAGKVELAVNLHRETFEKRKAMLGVDHADTLASLNNLGKAYRDAGKYDLALALLTDALPKVKAIKGENDPGTLTVMSNLASIYMDMGKLELALSLYRETLERTKAVRGPDHVETFASMINLAQAYREAGKLDLALPLAQDAVSKCKAKFGPNHPHTLRCMGNLAVAYSEAGKLESALPLELETLERCKVRLGANHPDTLHYMSNLAHLYLELDKFDLAVPLYRDAVELATESLGPNHPATITWKNNLAIAYRKASKLDGAKFDEAVKLHRANLEITKAKRGEDHPDTLRSMGNLAATYQAAGKYDLALPLYRDTLALLRKKLGDDHPFTLTIMKELAAAYYAAARPDLAGPLCIETLEKRKAKLGADHPETLASMNDLAVVFAGIGRYDLAVPLYEKTLAKMKALRPDHNETIACTINLADAYRATRKYDKAVLLLKEALEKKKARLGADHAGVLLVVNNLALTYHDSGQLDLALPLFIDTLEKFKKQLGVDNPQTLTTMNNLALTYRSKGQLDLAVPLYIETLKGRLARLGADHPDTVWSLHNLAGTYMKMGKYADAEPLLVSWLAAPKSSRPPDELLLASNLNRLGECRLALKKYVEAEKALRDGLAIFEKKAPKTGMRYETENLLGAALAGQEKIKEAEELLVSSGKVLLKFAPRLDAYWKRRAAAAVERVIEFYVARGNAEEAANWRTLRDAAFPPEKKKP
jgi:serine/threonine protein kinase